MRLQGWLHHQRQLANVAFLRLRDGWVARLLGAADVREVALFPRDLHRLTP